MDKSKSKLLPCAHLVRTTDGKTTQCDFCGAVGDVINPNWEPRWRDAPASVDSQEREAELPPLPEMEVMGFDREDHDILGFTAGQMQEYARAALAAPKQPMSALTALQALVDCISETRGKDATDALHAARAVLAAAQERKS